MDRSRISRRLAAGSLWSFVVDGHIRVPLWQFVGDALLPGLPEVIASIPPEHTPLAIAALIEAPQEQLGGRTPVEFLAEGGEAPVVAELVADLGRW